jgi:hypothetical protein
MAILMEFLPLSHEKKEGTRPPQNSWQLSASILTTFSGFRLKPTFRHVYKLTKFVLDHESHYASLGDNPYKAEYRDTADVAQCGEHPMAQTDHIPHKASL